MEKSSKKTTMTNHDMTNLEYLEKVKKSERKYLDVLIKNDIARHNDFNDNYRKIKALEIIAEELIKSNDNLDDIITTLENIDNTINQR